jgi:hypothetical protein
VESTCAAGECAAKVLVTGVQPKGLAVDGGNLYFADDLTAAIRVLPADGSAPPTTFAAGQDVPLYLTIAAGKVYWTKGDGTLMMQPIGGSAASVVASGLATPLGVGVSGSSVYVAEASTGSLLQIPIAGGSQVTLSTTSTANFVEGLATDGQYVWVAYNQGGQIVQHPLSGSPETAFVTNEGSPAGVALDASWVYWANQGSGEVRKKPKSGGGVVTLKTGVDHAVGVAVDASFVYFAEGNLQRILRVAK